MNLRLDIKAKVDLFDIEYTLLVLIDVQFRVNSYLGVLFTKKIEAFCTKNEDFDQIDLNTYRLKNSKYGKVKPRSDIP